MEKVSKILDRKIKPLNFINKLLNLFIKNGKRSVAFKVFFNLILFIRRKKGKNVSFQTFFKQILVNTKFSINMVNIHLTRRKQIRVPKLTTSLKENSRAARMLIARTNPKIRKHKAKNINKELGLKLLYLYKGEKKFKVIRDANLIKQEIRRNRFHLRRLKKL